MWHVACDSRHVIIWDVLSSEKKVILTWACFRPFHSIYFPAARRPHVQCALFFRWRAPWLPHADSGVLAAFNPMVCPIPVIRHHTSSTDRSWRPGYTHGTPPTHTPARSCIQLIPVGRSRCHQPSPLFNPRCIFLFKLQQKLRSFSLFLFSLSLCLLYLSFFLSFSLLARSQQRQCLHSLSDAVGAHHRGHDQARARVPASHRSTRGRDCATKGTTGRARRYRGIHQEGREGTSASVTVCARPPRGLPPHRPHRIRACIVCL